MEDVERLIGRGGQLEDVSGSGVGDGNGELAGRAVSDKATSMPPIRRYASSVLCSIAITPFP